MQISLVIPNFNGRHLLAKNLPHVIKAFSVAEIFVVDDGSSDGSAKFLKQSFPNVKLLEKATTSGFSTSVNLGFKVAIGEIVVLLNTDVVPKADFLGPLLSHFEDPNIFAVGCLEESIEGAQTTARGRGIGRFRRGFLEHRRGEGDKTDTLWASGGASAFKKSLWDKLHGFNEIYDPFYWEDIDVSYRALKSGYQVLFESRSRVTHRHEEGSIKKQYSANEVRTIAYRNQFIFVWKNITDLQYFSQHLFWLPYHLFFALIRGDLAMWKGFGLALLRLPRIWISRGYETKLYTKTDA